MNEHRSLFEIAWGDLTAAERTMILGAAATGHRDALHYVDSNLPRMLPPMMLPAKWVTCEPEVRERWQQEISFYRRAVKARRTGRSWRAGLARCLLSV